MSNFETFIAGCNVDLEDACYRSSRFEDRFDARLQEELTHIRTQELAPYYLALQEKDETVDTDRHLVAYLLYLTDRFSVNFDPPMMGDMPDIDTDFSERAPVVDYLKEKYGDDHVAYISNYTHLSGKSVLQDVARVMEINIPKKIKDAVEEVGSVKKFLELDLDLDDDIKEALQVGANLEGNIRQMGITAAGVVVSKDPITDYCAMWKNDKGYVAIDKDIHDAEATGFIKMDVLRTKNVAAIQRTLELIEERGGTPPEDVWNLPMDDKKVIKEFQKANTDLIFQYGGDSAKALLPRLKPENVEDIIAANALCRLGADDAAYIRRKEGKEKYSFYNKDLRDILGDTYGVMVYQEQVMAICRRVAGMSHQDVNRVRKMVGKKTYKDEPELKGLFMMGCKKRGIEEGFAANLWAEIKKHGEYSFNRAHSVAYFLVAWVNMYLQVHHPFEWYLANLQIEEDDDRIATIISYAQRAKIKFSNVDVNKSKATWSYAGDVLVPGLSNIRGLGKKTAEKIVKKVEEIPVVGWDTHVFRPGLKTEHIYYYLIQEGYDAEKHWDKKIELPKNAFEALKDAGAIPGLEGDPVRAKIAAGMPLDVTEGKEIHPSWNAVSLSDMPDTPCVVHCYVKSATKSGSNYKLNLQGDTTATMYCDEQLEAGPYLLVCDGKWKRVYYAVPESKWARHPMTPFSKDALLGTWGPGVVFYTGSSKVNSSYVAMVLAPQPRTIWFKKPLERGWYLLNFKKDLKGWQTKLLKRAK